jgi:hypothetical protein
VKRAFALLGVLPLLAACGSSSHVSVPTVQAARTYRLANFQPTSAVQPGTPTTVSFTVDQPSGAPLTQYRTGAGPHTGIHLIIVRDDLATIVHQHPPIGPDGRVTGHVTFPLPGRYHVLVDVYPKSGTLPNFQLFHDLDVAGAAHAQPLPPFQPRVEVGGYRLTVHGHPTVRALEPTRLPITVTDPAGHPVRFTAWFGAIAHAIFFRKGSLAYFHTHVCGATTPACAGPFGATRISGTSSRPGQLSVGVLLPQAGVWRLFLQFKAGGKILTAPFTLDVR